MPQTEQGEIKNIVDALRRSLDQSTSLFASGGVGIGYFSVSIVPSSGQHPAGTLAVYGHTVIVKSADGFQGTVSLAVTKNNLIGGTVTLHDSSVTVSPDSQGITSISVTVPTTTPIGTYTIVVTGTSGTLTDDATLTITVTEGTPPPGTGCKNDADCQPGEKCCDGVCYGDLCTSDNQCKLTYGSCSKCQLMPGRCGGHKRCTLCTGTETIVKVTCPADINAVAGTQQVVSTTMVVTNVSDTTYTVSMGGQFLNFAPCIGPVVFSPGTFTLSLGASQTVTVSATFTCATVQCLNYQINVTVGDQVATCAWQLCIVPCSSSTTAIWGTSGVAGQTFTIQQYSAAGCFGSYTITGSCTTGATTYCCPLLISPSPYWKFCCSGSSQCTICSVGSWASVGSPPGCYGCIGGILTPCTPALSNCSGGCDSCTCD